MTADSLFLAALVDTLFPGGTITESVELPSASSVGCDRALHKRSEKLDSLIAKITGDSDAFIRATNSGRAAILQAAQSKEPEAFAELVTLTLTHYFAQDQVLKAIGWRTEPPQPKGHVLSPFDDRLLEPVRARGAIWRRV